MAKLFVSEAANRCADRCLQIFGGRGYTRTNVAERFWRELRVDRIWEGTSEIQRLIVARALERRGVERVLRLMEPASPARAALGGGRRRVRAAGVLRRRGAAEPRAARLRRAGVRGQPAARGGARRAGVSRARGPAGGAGRGRRRDPRGRRAGRRRAGRARWAAAARSCSPPGSPRRATATCRRGSSAAAGGLPVCGPNGNGIVSLPDRVALWGDTVEPREPGPVARDLAERQRRGQRARLAARAAAAHGRLVRQPGRARRRRLPRARSPSATACASVALYLEDDGDGERWCAALRSAARAPACGVAVLKAGRSRGGRGGGGGAHRRARRRPARLPRAVRGVRRRLGRGPARPARAGEGARRAARGRRGRGGRRGHDLLRRRLGDRGRPRRRARRRPARARARDDRAARGDAARRGDRGQPARLHVAAVGRAGRAARADRGARRRPGVGQRARALRRSCRRRALAPILDAVKRRRRRDRRLDAARAVPATGGIAGLRSALLAAKALATTPDPSGSPRSARRAGRMRGDGLEEHEAKALLRDAGHPRRPRLDGHRRGAPSPPGASSAAPVALKRTGLRHKAATAAWSSTSTTSSRVKQAYRRLGGTVLVERMAAPRHRAAGRGPARRRSCPCSSSGSAASTPSCSTTSRSSRCPSTRRASTEALQHAPDADRRRTPIATPRHQARRRFRSH